MRPIVLGSNLPVPAPDLLRDTVTLAVMGPKGGVGKSLIAQLIAVFAAVRGIPVRLIDLDGQPTLTAQFAHYTNSQLLRQLRVDPMRLTIQGLMLHPGNGEALMRLDYPIGEVLLTKLPNRPRMPVSRINPATIVQRTLQHYDIDVERIAPMIVLPNCDSFEPFIFAVAEAKARDRRFAAEQLLKRALTVQEQLRARQGLPPIHLNILDVAGERSTVSANAIHAATHILPVFNMGDASVEGLMSVAADVRDQRSLSADPSHFARILPAVANMFDESDDEECSAWIDQTVRPRLSTVSIQVVGREHYIPWTRDPGRADRRQVMAFEYNPLDHAVQAVEQLTRYLLPVLAGRAA
jgi:cellulose biosynthesis protein BcsQ